jgi:poly(A) polymerase
MRSHAEQLARISPERIAEELRMMLTPPTRAWAWSMLHEFALDDVIFRFFELPWPTPASGVSAGRWVVFFDRLSPGESISFGLALAAASVEYLARCMPHLGDWPKLLDQLSIRKLVHAMRQALRISNDEADEMEGTLFGMSWLVRTATPSVAQLKRFLARPTARHTRRLLAALPPEFGHAPHHDQIETRLRKLEKTEFAPSPLITGDDLVALGMQPGPKFKVLLDSMYDEQLEGRLNSRDDAIAFVKRRAESGD